jgi:5-methylcytosine-specific restriction endonuclease McrA
MECPRCSVCNISFSSSMDKKAYFSRPSFSFPFACTGCVVRSCRMARRHNRRAKKHGVMQQMSPADWLNTLKRHNFHCACCGDKDCKLTLDHIKPLKEGGSNGEKNMQPLCFMCHAKKDGYIPKAPNNIPKHLQNKAA